MVPWEIYQHLTVNLRRSALSTLRDLVAIVGANESHAEVTDYATICCQLFGQLASSLNGETDSAQPTEVEAEALRHGLLLVLKAYGTPDQGIDMTALGLRVEDDYLPSRMVG